MNSEVVKQIFGDNDEMYYHSAPGWEMCLRSDHNTENYICYSFQSVTAGSFTSHFQVYLQVDVKEAFRRMANHHRPIANWEAIVSSQR